ncbi:hypothetical protein QCA50_005915 [Cerrena zonata]|uniref:Uncharacterized protein n=1 Tax=Cerrena zonata TaxID=2478898 RepID=A0AAW0GHX2_9APHY
MSTAVKVPISALQLPPTSHTLTQNLTPDPHTPSPSDFRTVQKEKPSIQRRGRILDPPSHFSFVSPLPIAFPYKIIQEEGETESQSSQIERYLSERESLHEKPNAPSPIPGVLKKYYPSRRKERPASGTYWTFGDRSEGLYSLFECRGWF